MLATIPVSIKYTAKDGRQTEAEDGLIGLVADPNFNQNHWLYLYYSLVGDEAKNVLVRYELRSDELVMDSKKVLLDVATQREQCYHTGGGMAFDKAGNLFLSTGDNTSPRDTPFNPIDERPERAPWNAQKSSGNTNDLRGKIIRIHPETNGTAGNEPPVVAFDILKGNKPFFFREKPIEYAVKVTDKEDGSLATGKIIPAQVAVSIDYLPEGFDPIEVAQNHRGTETVARFATGQRLIGLSDCKSCHLVDKKSVGPGCTDVAKKYKDEAAAVDRLAKKIIAGGGGVWGALDERSPATDQLRRIRDGQLYSESGRKTAGR